MALAANTVWELRTTGSDNNGGGYASIAFGTDYSQQDAAQFSGTDLATTSGTTNPSVVTSATHNFVDTDVGNLINISAGTNWTAGIYQIVSVAGNAATLDRAAGIAASLSSGTWAEGGALATPGKVGSVKSTSHSVWIKSGTYTITSSTFNVVGGVVRDQTGGTASSPSFWTGYNSFRGDNGTPPILKATTGVVMTLLNSFGTYTVIDNITFDGSSSSSQVLGLELQGDHNHAIRIKAINMTGTNSAGITFGGIPANNYVIFCQVDNCYKGIDDQASGKSFYCTVTNCSSVGFTGFRSKWYKCIAYACGYGWKHSGILSHHIHCVAYGCTNDGFWTSTNGGDYYLNCISYGNGGYGYDSSTVSTTNLISRLINCAGGSNALGNTLNYVIPSTTGGTMENFITLTADPFNNAAGLDFSLNASAGGGALCRFAGRQTIGRQSVGYPDVGVAQHFPSGAAAPTPTPGLLKMGVLAQSVPSGGLLSLLYTCETGYTATVSSLVICNSGSTPGVFRVSIRVAGAAENTKQYLYYDTQIGSNETYSSRMGITMGSGDQVMVYASVPGVVFSLYGLES